MTQTVFVNARFLTQTMTGVQRYAAELSLRLLSSSSDFEYVFLSPKNILNSELATALNARPCGRLTGHAWEQLELPFFARGGLLFNPCNTAPALFRPQVVTIHDAAVYATPDAFSSAFRLWYKLLLPVLGRSASRIITVSEFSKRELMHYLRIPADKLNVIYQGVAPICAEPADRSVLARSGLGKRPFVLCVSSLSPRKNFQAVVRTAQLLASQPLDFVVAGGVDPRIYRHSATLPENIIQLGYVTNAELRALYEASMCYLFPSYYEGFGLTPLEAMSCGSPVIVSQAASLPEACGDAALYCDPDDTDTMAEQITRLLSDAELRAELRERGLNRAAQFSWESCARETITTLESALRA